MVWFMTAFMQIHSSGINITAVVNSGRLLKYNQSTLTASVTKVQKIILLHSIIQIRNKINEHNLYNFVIIVSLYKEPCLITY